MLMVAGDNLRQENSGFFFITFTGPFHCVLCDKASAFCRIVLKSWAGTLVLEVLHYSLHPLFFCESCRRHLLKLTSLHALFSAEDCLSLEFLGEVVFPVIQQLDFCFWVLNARWILAQWTTSSQSWTSSFSSLLLPKISSPRSCCPFLLLLSIFMSWQWKTIGMQPS